MSRCDVCYRDVDDGVACGECSADCTVSEHESLLEKLAFAIRFIEAVAVSHPELGETIASAIKTLRAVHP